MFFHKKNYNFNKHHIIISQHYRQWISEHQSYISLGYSIHTQNYREMQVEYQQDKRANWTNLQGCKKRADVTPGDTSMRQLLRVSGNVLKQ